MSIWVFVEVAIHSFSFSSDDHQPWKSFHVTVETMPLWLLMLFLLLMLLLFDAATDWMELSTSNLPKRRLSSSPSLLLLSTKQQQSLLTPRDQKASDVRSIQSGRRRRNGHCRQCRRRRRRRWMKVARATKRVIFRCLFEFSHPLFWLGPFELKNDRHLFRRFWSVVDTMDDINDDDVDLIFRQWISTQSIGRFFDSKCSNFHPLVSWHLESITLWMKWSFCTNMILLNPALVSFWLNHSKQFVFDNTTGSNPAALCYN